MHVFFLAFLVAINECLICLKMFLFEMVESSAFVNVVSFVDVFGHQTMSRKCISKHIV